MRLYNRYHSILIMLMFMAYAAAAPTDPAVTGETLQKIARKTIAELNLPYQDNQNPLISQTQDQLLASIKNYNVLRTPKEIKAIEVAAFAKLIGNAHLQASFDPLCVVVEFATWLFIYDDIIEKQKEKETIASLHARTMEIVEGAEVTKSDNALNQWFHNIMERIHRISKSSLWDERFKQDMQGYCQSTLWEFDNRERGQIPTPEEYLGNRSHTSGTKVMYDFIELLEGITLPQNIYESDYFQQMLKLGVNLVNWENDIISAPKEFMQGDIHNLVFVHLANNNLDFEKAFRQTALDLSSDLNRFMMLAQEVPDFGPHTEAVKRYISGMMNWACAHHFWAMVSPRYIIPAGS